MERHCKVNFSSEIQRREIENPNLVTLLSEESGGVLIGFAQVRLDSAIECVLARRPSELHRLYVLNRWHGLGVASELMREVLTTAERAASDRIWLGVWERNSKAIAFYRKFGFEVVGDHIFRLGSDPQRDLVMALDLDESAAA
jgi:ribosomal protein S18 acetylase RimI-like enzyme